MLRWKRELCGQVKVVDEVTGDEAGLGEIESWVEGESVLEVPATWPDLPPSVLLTYGVRVETSGESGNETSFRVSLNLRGEKGDIGLRALRTPVGTAPAAVFKPYNVDNFELSGASVGAVREIDLVVEASSKATKSDVHWHPTKITIHDQAEDRIAEFFCDKYVLLPSTQRLQK